MFYSPEWRTGRDRIEPFAMYVTCFWMVTVIKTRTRVIRYGGQWPFSCCCCVSFFGQWHETNDLPLNNSWTDMEINLRGSTRYHWNKNNNNNSQLPWKPLPNTRRVPIDFSRGYYLLHYDIHYDSVVHSLDPIKLICISSGSSAVPCTTTPDTHPFERFD